MIPISVFDAKPGRPYTITHDGTVRGLRDALDMLCANGHGGTAVVRADSEAGPSCARHLELYDTSKEVETGELDTPMIFLIC